MELHVTDRVVFGKKVNNIRKQGFVPGIVYGKHIKTPVAVQFEKNVFLKTYKTTGVSTPIDLTGDNKELVLIHHIDTDPVTDIVLHVDFLAVKADEKVKASVSIIIEGTSPAEKEGLGNIQLVKASVMVEALPRDLPHDIKVDISTLVTVQDSIFVSDLMVSDKVHILEDADQPVVVVAEIVEEKEDEAIVSTPEAAAGAAAAPAA